MKRDNKKKEDIQYETKHNYQNIKHNPKFKSIRNKILSKYHKRFKTHFELTYEIDILENRSILFLTIPFIQMHYRQLEGKQLQLVVSLLKKNRIMFFQKDSPTKSF